jgi:hypothetical protein
MIVHILRFSFKDGVREEDSAACLQAFRAVGEMDSVLVGVVGPYTGSEPGRYTHAATYVIADIAAFARYMNDPVHRSADFVVHPHVAAFDAFDTWDENDEDLPAKMAAIFQARVDGDPELAELIRKI